MLHPDEGTIHAWLDGALDDAEAAALEAHVAGCAPCGEAVAEARGLIAGASRVLGALDDVPGGVIPAATPAAVGALPDETAEVPAAAPARVLPMRPRGVAGRPMLRIAAGVLVVAGGAAALLRATGGRPEAVTAAAMDTAALFTTSGLDSRSEAAPAAAPAAELAPQPEAQGAAVGAAANAVMAPPAAPPAAAAPATGVVASGAGGGGASDAGVREEALRVAARAAVQRRESQRAIAAPLELRPAPRALDSLPVEQVVVMGVVRDEATGEPLPGASVLLDGGDIGTITDHLGRFTISGAASGVHRAEVKRMGYEPTTRDVRVGRETATLEVALAPSAVAQAAASAAAAPMAQVSGEAAKAADVALATRAKARRGAAPAPAGACLALSLRSASTTEDVRSVTVRLVPGDSLAFPRQADGMADAAGRWSPPDSAGRDAGMLRLRWTQGVEEVTVRLPWGDAPMQGLAAVRIGNVGVDAVATATRVSCLTLR